jgi:hypothetical protein
VTGTVPDELAPGLWSWARRHEEWHPGEFGAEVVSFMARAGDETLLLDPLLDGPDDPAWETIDAAVGDSVRVLISVPYHVRSSEPARERYAGEVAFSIHGHPACAERMESTEAFEAFAAGDTLPGDVTPHRIGKPVRHETPLHLPSHDAILFGDAVVGTDDGARVWSDQDEVTEKLRRFYAERFNPTLQPLAALEPEMLLMTHGPSFLSGGKAELERALERDPWHHRS